MDHKLMNLNYSRVCTLSHEWITVGNITVQGTSLATSGRSWSDLESYFSGTQTTYIGYSVPFVINAPEFRFQTTADGDSHVVEIWGARTKKDHFTLLVTLTLTGGSQEGDDSLYFVDTIVESNEGLFKSGKVMDSGNNRICRYAVDLSGYRTLLFLAPTLASSTNLRIQASGW